MEIVLGSTSPHKLEAVREACRRLSIEANVTGFKTSSAENEQPVDFQEMYQGALHRTLGVRLANLEKICIGIESGIVRIPVGPGVTFDFALIVLIKPDGERIWTSSSAIQFPEECVVEAEKRGFETTTVGSVIAERLGGDGTDPHAILTGGKLTRQMTLVDALVTLLRQL